MMNESTKILIVEDDQEISKLLSVIIEKAGMIAVPAYSGTEGLLLVQQDTYDVILLDLMLPGMSGEEFITQVKEYQIPKIVISAKIAIEDKVQVLQMGADDYITKPFHQEEVMARIAVQLRQSAMPSPSTKRSWRGLTIHPDKRSVTLESHELFLTNAEYDILSLLISHPERAFSKRQIYDKVWTGPYLGDDNTINVHVSNLRKKIAEITCEEYIKTIWGIGFMLV